MKLLIRDFARLCGVSVRTLHHYDSIGLLKPASVNAQNGYRFYDSESLKRMQEIMFYRELDFPLRDIAEIIAASDHDRQSALQAQRQLLLLKKERIERLIAAIDNSVKGEQVDMKAFDNSKFEAKRDEYAKEVRERWGNTAAFRESEQRTAGYSADDRSRLAEEMNSLMAEFARCMQSGETAESRQAQELVHRWQSFISEHYYHCTDEILAGLGQMYAADERFSGNIDAHGCGTAQFMSDAIAAYCVKRND